MKVLVIGANGKIGKQLVTKLHQHPDFEVKAMVRKEEQIQSFKETGIETVLANLEGTVESLQEVMQGCDAIVFTAGSGSKTGPDKTILVDLDGAVKTIEAAEAAGVRRYIMVSAYQANNRENWSPRIKHYYAAKHYADRILSESTLDYTIVRPGGLLDEPGTGKVNIGENLPRTLDNIVIPREDVANTIIACLENSNTIRRSFDIISGETPIKEAINCL